MKIPIPQPASGSDSLRPNESKLTVSSAGREHLNSDADYNGAAAGELLLILPPLSQSSPTPTKHEPIGAAPSSLESHIIPSSFEMAGFVMVHRADGSHSFLPAH